jgi:membrane fusion protein, copper/silver efflux system
MTRRCHELLAVLLAIGVGLSGCHRSGGQTHGVHRDEPPATSEPKPAAEGHAGHEAASAVPEGYAAISVEPARAKAIGLTTTNIDERDFLRRLRTTGIVTVDETRTSHVHPKVRGWIDGIRVNYIGQKVAAGQELARIYSQDVYAAEIEYLALLDRTRGALPAGEPWEQERRARDELIAAARRRLALWDVPPAEIARLETSREAARTFPLLAPRSGIVVAKQAFDGTYVDPSVELYTVSDLSRVWVLADIYEADVAAVRVGQPARLEIQGIAQPIDTKVTFLPPTIDQPTRTLKVRFDLPNKAGTLRPGAFASVSMDLPLGRGLAVPESAVVRTGARAIVFVVHESHIAPREVELGPLAEDHYRVEEGLSPDDVVATGAQFLLDSETRLRASSGPGAGHGGH